MSGGRSLCPLRLGVVAAAALAVGLAPAAARADGESAPSQPRGDGAPATRRLVLLFAPPEAEPLAGRLEAELVAAGLPPRRVTIAPATRFEELAVAVAAAHAEGGIRVEPDATGAEVWITEPATGRTLLRQSLTANASPAMISVIALRTVEFLRASLLPAEAPPPPPPTAAPVAVAVAVAPAEPLPSSSSRVRCSLAPAWLASPGGVGGTFSAAGALVLRVLPHVGIEALALVPISAGTVATEQGESRLAVFLAGAGAQVRWSAARWTWDLGAGALAAHVRATGTAGKPLIGAAASMTGIAPYARAGAALGLSSFIALRADVLVGALTPRPIVEVDTTGGGTRDAGHWGRPFGAVLLGLQGGGS